MDEIGGIRVGVIGTGYWGRNLVRNFHMLGSLAAICDTNSDTRESQVALYPGILGFDEYPALINDPEIDAIAIATPASTHGVLARKCIEAGKHVFVEKPLCLEVDVAVELGRLSADHGVTLMVGHLLLYHPAFRALCAVVDSGRIGKLHYIYSNRASLGKVRTEENALWSFAPHDVSMILALAGRLPENVIATGAYCLTKGVADITLSHLTFSDDLQAHIFVSWLHPYKDHRMVVVGSNGMIVFDDVAEGVDKLLLYPHVSSREGGVPVISRAAAEPIAYDPAEPLRCECAHFLECVLTGTRPDSDAAEGTRVLRVLQACE